jgi:septal ring factor EnvC (AmiA/AmiB activator)
MAMNEDSVVSSLNELRRMANERSRREAEARREAERQAGHGRRSAAPRNTLTQGYPEAKIHVDGGYPQNGQEPAGTPQGSYGG